MYVGIPAPQNRRTELDKLTTKQAQNQIGLFPAAANRTQTSAAVFLEGEREGGLWAKTFQTEDKLGVGSKCHAIFFKIVIFKNCNCLEFTKCGRSILQKINVKRGL